ncbi:NADPH:quinone reductase [Mariniphaga anaerophila]|uniref:NADPH:quinone reductase n=1 Tax=Mariniphaga anaerophila TaxID=1484053 RepID=A0A1M4Y5T2_9BACT|nr:NAD(P)-dependent alcohol dehydrogenase [Mariniphaga anaerophila]SHF01065.1 NADPH:quinone reductase [Mariniphaga anaerophila]
MPMRAVLYSKTNRQKKLVCQEIEEPVPAAGEVLIRVEAVALNAADYRMMRMGIAPKKKIFGADIAGRIESTGNNVQIFKPGDEVIADLSGCGFGGMAEYVAVPEKYIIRKPAGISFENAAALPMASVTALQALRNKGAIKNGQNVLIIGSGGGVGTFAVQLAKYFGAKVTAVCGPENVELARSLGADKVIDYTKENFLEGQEPYDLILAANGNYSLSACKRMLNKNGIYVLSGGALIQIFKTMAFGWFMSLGSKKIRFLAAKPEVKDLEFILSLVANQKITPVVDRVYLLEESADAFKYMGEGHAKGKVVLKVR